MESKREQSIEKPAEYMKPEVKDYGDLKELTAASAKGAVTDVPKGFPVGLS